MVVGVIVVGAEWWIEASKWVSTDDAFIDTHTVQVSAQVAGRVKAVLVGSTLITDLVVTAAVAFVAFIV